MKLMRLLFFGALVLGGLAFASHQAQKRVLVSDKKGDFKIFDVESAVTSFDPGGDMEFEATGLPLKGFSKQQGLSFSARSLAGVASRSAGGALRIKRALVKGDVLIDTKSIVSGGGGETTSHIEGSSMLMDERESTNVVTFDQPFTFSNRLVSPGTDRTITVGSPHGEFVLPLLSQASGSNNPFLSADLKGPVKIDIDSVQKSGAGTARWKIALVADAMTYSAQDRTIRLTGHVAGDVESTPAAGEPFGFIVGADWLNIVLDESSQVKSVKSGMGSAKQKGGEK